MAEVSWLIESLMVDVLVAEISLLTMIVGCEVLAAISLMTWELVAEISVLPKTVG